MWSNLWVCMLPRFLCNSFFRESPRWENILLCPHWTLKLHRSSHRRLSSEIFVGWMNGSLAFIWLLGGWKDWHIIGSMKCLVTHSHCCCSVTWSCPTLCNPMDCSMPGFLVLHHLPSPFEFAQTYIESVMPFNHLVLCHTFLLLPSIFPASGSLLTNWLFPSGGQSIGTSVSASVLPLNIQSWFPWGLTGLISLQSKGLTWSPTGEESSPTSQIKASILRHSAFFMVQLSHPYMTTRKIIALTRWTFVSNIQFSSVTLTLCKPMDCSMPGFPVHHQLLELPQTHALPIGDAIQPSHPLPSPSLPALNLSQHQGLFKWVSFSHQVAKVLELQLQHQSSQWLFRTDFL